MGCSADAHLVFGVPVEAYDDDGEPTQFWDEASDDWVDFAELQLKQDGHVNPWDSLPDEINNGGNEAFKAWKLNNPEWHRSMDAWYTMKRAAESSLNLEFCFYGDFIYSSEPRAILTTSRVKHITGYSYEATKLESDSLVVSDKAISKAGDALRSLGFDVSFYDAAWYLVASYG